MANFLEDVGRSNLHQSLGTFVDYAQGNKRLELQQQAQDLRAKVDTQQLAVHAEDLKIKQRQNKLEEEKVAQMDKPLLVSGLSQNFYGGTPVKDEQGKVVSGLSADYAEKIARSMGYIEDSPAGGSFIKAKHAQEVLKTLHDPQHATQLGLLSEQEATKKYNTIKQQFDQEVNPKKKQELGLALNQALQEVQTFRGNNEGLMKYLEQQTKANKVGTELDLTARAQRGDKEAQKILDAKHASDLEIAGKKAEATADAKGKGIDIPVLAQAVMEGQDAPIAIRGSMGNPVATKVKSEILKQNPKFDFSMADANYKWRQSATNQRTINFAGGALPRLSMLDEQLSKLPNVNLNTINKIMRTVSVEVGKPEYTNFESNRNAIVQEVNTALSGSSQGSDLRVQIELDNLKSARSPQQISGAISNLREALIARVDVDLSPLYPMEVVRGEKTMAAHKAEMFAKYRGNYDKQKQHAVGSEQKQVVERRQTKDGKILVKYSDGTIGEE